MKQHTFYATAYISYTNAFHPSMNMQS